MNPSHMTAFLESIVQGLDAYVFCVETAPTDYNEVLTQASETVTYTRRQNPRALQ